MGWRITVKAGRVRDMKNKRRKTGKKRGWSGGGGPGNNNAETLPTTPTTPTVAPAAAAAATPDPAQLAAAAAANPTSSTAQPNIIIEEDVLDQNNLCIALDSGHVIIKQDNQNCIGNACLYYAINNVVNDFPTQNEHYKITYLINNLIDTTIIQPTNTYLQYAPITEERYINLIYWCLEPHKIKFVTIQNNNLSFIEHVDLSGCQTISANLYNDKNPLPWVNDSLSVVALVQGLRNYDEKDENIKDGTGHFIAIKIVGNDVHIADSFHSDNPIYTGVQKVPIDRKKDPFVKKIIDELFEIRRNEKEMGLGAFSNQSNVIPPSGAAAAGTPHVASSPTSSSSAVPPHVNRVVTPNVAESLPSQPSASSSPITTATSTVPPSTIPSIEAPASAEPLPEIEQFPIGSKVTYINNSSKVYCVKKHHTDLNKINIYEVNDEKEMEITELKSALKPVPNPASAMTTSPTSLTATAAASGTIVPRHILPRLQDTIVVKETCIGRLVTSANDDFRMSFTDDKLNTDNPNRTVHIKITKAGDGYRVEYTGNDSVDTKLFGAKVNDIVKNSFSGLYYKITDISNTPFSMTLLQCDKHGNTIASTVSITVKQHDNNINTYSIYKVYNADTQSYATPALVINPSGQSSMIGLKQEPLPEQAVKLDIKKLEKGMIIQSNIDKKLYKIIELNMPITLQSILIRECDMDGVFIDDSKNIQLNDINYTIYTPTLYKLDILNNILTNNLTYILLDNETILHDTVKFREKFKGLYKNKNKNAVNTSNIESSIKKIINNTPGIRIDSTTKKRQLYKCDIIKLAELLSTNSNTNIRSIYEYIYNTLMKVKNNILLLKQIQSGQARIISEQISEIIQESQTVLSSLSDDIQSFLNKHQGIQNSKGVIIQKPISLSINGKPYNDTNSMIQLTTKYLTHITTTRRDLQSYNDLLKLKKSSK